jgi:hypothetical protein
MSRLETIRPLRLIFVAFWIQAGAGAAFGQDTTLTATVVQVAGENVYLNIGRADGVLPRDTLGIGAAGRTLGRMVAISTSSRQSILAFASTPFPLTRGMTVDVAFRKRTPPRTPPAPAETPEPTRPPTVLAARKSSPARPAGQRVRVDGRITLALSMLHSETQSLSAELEPVGRRFATPSLNLNATVRNLPSNTRLHANIRTEYRSQTTPTLLPQKSVRTYQLSLQKTLSFGEMQFGRFYNGFTAHGGYWDGASLLLGSRRAGAGVTVGFMPEQANEGFTTEFPRVSGFLHFRTPAKQHVAYRVSASYHEVHPTALYLDHRFGEFMQQLDWRALSIDQDIQIDQDPLTNHLVITQFQLDARVRVTEGLQLKTRYFIRQPYRMYSTVSPISARRDQIGIGFQIRKNEGSIGGEFSNRYTEGAFDSRTLLLYGNTPFIQPISLSLTGNASYWTSTFGDALYASAGLMQAFRSGHTRIDYAFYRTTAANQENPIDVHRVSLSTSLPIGRALFWNARISLQQSHYLRSASGQTSLQVRL